MLVPMIMVQAIPHSWEIYATRTDTRGENFMLYFFFVAHWSLVVLFVYGLVNL